MHTKTISALSALLQAKQVSATELANLYLKRIHASPKGFGNSIDCNNKDKAYH